jgi:hypothetical protein
LLGGKDENVTILPNKTSDGLVITGDKWSLEIIALDSDGKTRKLNPDGSLNAVIEGKIKVIGSGYLGTSDYRIFLFANLVLAENSKTNEAGSFTWSFVLPAVITSGRHTIQVNGVSPARQVRSTSVGITVSAKPVPVATTKPTVKPTPKPKSTVGVIPFNFAKYLVGSKQLSIVKKLNLSGSKLQISLTGYAQRNGTRDDLRISLDRALEVKKAILKIAPKAVITVYGAGTKPTARCKSFNNRCVIVTISTR